MKRTHATSAPNNPQFVPHEHDEPSFDFPLHPQPLSGYLKSFAARPEADEAHTRARHLIAAAFNEHMANPPLGAADFGDSLVHSLSAILHTDLRHRLTFNVKLRATLTVGRFRAHSLAFVLSEILLNALKHARPDGGRISLEIECLPGPNGETRLSVRDDGIGLPPGFAEWADGGVGLFRIRYALEQMGASLNLESDDLGVRFAMEIAPPVEASKATLPKILSPYSAHYLNDAANPHAYTPD
jgi:two-component sensor histidine kinase